MSKVLRVKVKSDKIARFSFSKSESQRFRNRFANSSISHLNNIWIKWIKLTNKDSFWSLKWALFKKSKTSKIERVRIELWWKSHRCFANIVKSCLANTFSAWSFKSQNYCDNESIFIISATLNCAHSALQCWLNEWKSYVIVDWNVKCEAIVQIRQITKNWTKHFCKHLNWRSDINLTTTWSFKFQNYCDNESIFVIFTTLKCAHFALQFWLYNWKSYVIVNWNAKCAAIVRFSHQKIILMIDLKEFDAFSHSNVDLFQYFQLMKRVSTILSLIKKFLDRSFASSEFTEHFFIKSVLSKYCNFFKFLKQKWTIEILICIKKIDIKNTIANWLSNWWNIIIHFL